MALSSGYRGESAPEPPPPAQPAEVGRLARNAYLALVCAAVGALFVTQLVKHQPSIVQSVTEEAGFSPTGIGHRLEHISFRIKHSDEATVTVVNSLADDVATLARDRQLHAYRRVHLVWNGRGDSGRLEPDGRYRLRVRLRNENRSVLIGRSFLLNTRPAPPVITAITPASGVAAGGTASASSGPAILPDARGAPLRIAFYLSGGQGPELFIYRTDVSPAPLVTKLAVAAGASNTTWDGTVHGRRVVPGTYLVAIRDIDPQGNVGAAPAQLPATGTPQTLPALVPGTVVPGHGGITVRELGVQPPVVATTNNAQVEFGVDARRRHYTWAMTRVGAHRPRARGRASRPLLRLAAPGGITGLYLLAVATAGARTEVPFAVQGPFRQKVLLVLPAITWLGTDPLDDDGDGLPNTLVAGDAVRLDRIFAAGLPSGFATQIEPLVRFLDRRHLRYDVTTDLALATHSGVALRGHSGIVLAGDERWLPANVASQLRVFVRHGGKLASFGVQSLRGSVAIAAGQLVRPTPLRPTDLFGARIGPLTSGSATLTNFLDKISLFGGGGGQFSGYDFYEPTESVGAGSELVASAVTADGRPVITAARYGSGTVLRVGVGTFATHLASDPNAAALVRQIWTLLSH